MNSYYVNAVIDGDTFNVTPNWAYRGQSGSRVRLRGVNAAELGHRGGLAAKRRLSAMVLRKRVTLRNIQRINWDRLVCDVYVGASKVRI
ncbi:MAG: hypothetical protein OXG13_09325 [Gemmatimonadaceae bacterium]|nr:hypothetical protein [Gemmatimonadaceae bacterium]